MDPISQFESERAQDIKNMAADKELQQKSLDWMIHADKYKYTYNFSWMGRPVIKFPSDMILQQEIMWDIKPDLIIETGIAHGGSIIFSAAMQEMMGIPNSEVVGIDIDIRKHNRDKIEAHPMARKITMYEGDSTSAEMMKNIEKHMVGKKTVMVILDSNHTHDHVYKELLLYTNFVSLNSYLVLPDTFIEHFPKGYYSDRPWDVGNNPMTAMRKFLEEDSRFEIDKERGNKLMITEAIDGYLKRTK